VILPDPSPPSNTKAWLASALAGLLFAGFVARAIDRPSWLFFALAPVCIAVFRIGISWRDSTGAARDQWTMKYTSTERIGYDPPRDDTVN